MSAKEGDNSKEGPSDGGEPTSSSSSGGGGGAFNNQTVGNSFVNSGLARWERAREQWLAHKSVSDTDDSSTARAAVPLEVDEIIDVIFSPRWRNAGNEVGPPRRFPQNVPLPQMVDVLVDLWEAEGLDT
mmetsp:Transcript_73055/g.205219  ORF Transcript_73055/g.205219 Transcript_73055/m.205219 type:complete len:129 (+) Transcript_73055:225-611(+)